MDSSIINLSVSFIIPPLPEKSTASVVFFRRPIYLTLPPSFPTEAKIRFASASVSSNPRRKLARIRRASTLNDPLAAQYAFSKSKAVRSAARR
ncbi:MAG: hypothetical protein NC202_02645 [Roseburia sp.]|nr:hypothetical protein [Roseburia sp.]